MSVLKSEIEQYLLENNFSLVKHVISSDTMFVYKSKMLKGFTVFISAEKQDNHVVCYFETIEKKYKMTHADRMILNSLDDFKFLATRCMRSPLCNPKLFT